MSFLPWSWLKKLGWLKSRLLPSPRPAPLKGGEKQGALRRNRPPQRQSRPLQRTYSLSLECLEDRTLLSAGDSIANAIPISWYANNTAAAIQQYIAAPQDVEIYALILNQGDTVTATVSTQAAGGGLDSFMRIFDSAGLQIATNDSYFGHDPQLTFQATVAGTYYVGVSSSGNDLYDPFTPQSGQGSSTGLFDLNLRKTNAALLPDLVGASFNISSTTAVVGDQLNITYAVENRGGATTAPGFNVKFYLSADNTITAADTLLTTRAVGPLAAGASFTETFSFTLPAVAVGTKYIGAIVDANSAVAESNELNNSSSPQHGNNWEALNVLTPQTESAASNDTVATAQSIVLNSRTSGTITAGDVDFYKITLTQDGRLTVQVHTDGFAARLSLYDGNGILLIQSDGQSPLNLDPLIDQHLEGVAGGTTYYLKVEGIAGGIGGYDLTARFAAGAAPFQPIPVPVVDGEPFSSAAAEFNGDGILDLATVNSAGNTVTIMLGLGDGTFQYAGSFVFIGAVGGQYVGFLTVGDFNGDGRIDLAMANSNSNNVTVLLGLGDGTFQSGGSFAVGNGPRSLTVGDFDGNGWLDIATANNNDVTVLLGLGNGTFQNAVSFVVGMYSQSLTVGDFNGDGRLDIATANYSNNFITVLLGLGNGTFQNAGSFAVGNLPYDLTVGDFNGDERLDIATTNDNNVTVLLGLGDGTFQSGDSFAVGSGSRSLTVGDFNGDGRIDIATANTTSDNVTVLLGMGDGTFQNAGSFSVGSDPMSLTVGDFNVDGRIDIATASNTSDNVTVLLAMGDGIFQNAGNFAVGNGPWSLTVGDFNGDGRLDIATANRDSNNVTILLCLGDGIFQNAGSFAVGNGPRSLTVGDFNGDGRIDIATANYDSNNITILLGLGDGTFQNAGNFVVGNGPWTLTMGDFNGDGRIDLVTANRDSNNVTILLGLGDGTFQNAGSFAVGSSPRSLILGDFNRDGWLDIATANLFDNNVTILLGLGDGTFQNGGSFAVGNGPRSLTGGDFNGDGRLDIATVNSSNVTVLLSLGDGTFQNTGSFAVGNQVVSLTVGDFNADGHIDIVTSHALYDIVTVLLGLGDGTFQNTGSFVVGITPRSLTVGDFNGDGRIDIATANTTSDNVTVLLGLGDGTFYHSGITSNVVQATPLFADLSGDSVPDMVVLRQDGKILFRQGKANNPGVFDPPVIVEMDGGDFGEDIPARDVAVISIQGRNVLAVLDTSLSRVLRYTFNSATGTFDIWLEFDVPGNLPVRIAAGDLNGDGRDDLVVTAAISNQVYVYLQDSAGSFGATPTYTTGVGVSPSAIDFVDMNNDGRRDIVVANQFSGDVSILLNDALSPFAVELRFRAGFGPYGMGKLVETNPFSTVQSQEGTVAVVAGQFNADSATDLIAVNSASHSASVLLGDGAGGYFNPQSSLSFPLEGQVSAVVTARFNQDAFTDLAVLDRTNQQIHIYVGSGAGGFTQTVNLDAGNVPTGLSVADVNGDMKTDLLVGNEFGDVLIILGNGDGTFQPFTRADRAVTMITTDVNGDGVLDAITVNQATDQVTVQIRQAGTATFTAGAFEQNRADGLQGPGNVKLADLNADGLADLIVANSGSNNVLVYLGTGAGQFAASRSFFAGTNPVGLTVEDLNADGTLDLAVANEGSNDVSILFGQGTGGAWTMTIGPRLDTGAGPTAVEVRDQTGDGIADLIVTNSQGGTLTSLPGIGNNGAGTGFFNDVNPLTLNVGGVIRQAPNAAGFLVTQGGAILQFNSATFTVTPVFAGGAGREVSFVRSRIENGSLEIFAARADGSISLLEDVNGQLSETHTFTDPRLADISMLEIAGDTELYVTNEGESVPIVIGIDLRGLVHTPAGGGGNALQVNNLSPLENGSLALVPSFTLAAGEDVALEEGLGAQDFGALAQTLRSLFSQSGGGNNALDVEQWSNLIDRISWNFNAALDTGKQAVDAVSQHLAQIGAVVRDAFPGLSSLGDEIANDANIRGIIDAVVQGLYDTGRGTLNEISRQLGGAGKRNADRPAPAEDQPTPPKRKSDEEPDQESQLFDPPAMNVWAAGPVPLSADMTIALLAAGVADNGESALDAVAENLVLYGKRWSEEIGDGTQGFEDSAQASLDSSWGFEDSAPATLAGLLAEGKPAEMTGKDACPTEMTGKDACPTELTGKNACPTGTLDSLAVAALLTFGMEMENVMDYFAREEYKKDGPWPPPEPKKGPSRRNGRAKKTKATSMCRHVANVPETPPSLEAEALIPRIPKDAADSVCRHVANVPETPPLEAEALIPQVFRDETEHAPDAVANAASSTSPFQYALLFGDGVALMV